jgi:hypothetical protein
MKSNYEKQIIYLDDTCPKPTKWDMQEFSQNFSNKNTKNNITKMNEEENLFKKIPLKKNL